MGGNYKVISRDGNWWARVWYTGQDGKRREQRRLARTKTDAAALGRKLLAEIEKSDGRPLHHRGKTFADLADLYDAEFLVPVQYDGNDTKTKGMRGEYHDIGDDCPRCASRKDRECPICEGSGKAKRRGGKGSLYTAKLQLVMLREHFGAKLVRSITPDNVKQFQDKRFETPTKALPCAKCDGKVAESGAVCRVCKGKGTVTGRRTWATVNREMTMLGKMLKFARMRGWIAERPFDSAQQKFVQLANEKKRKVILEPADEFRLLAACSAKTLEGKRLRAVIVCAVETGMRQGEIFRLTSSDVDLVNRSIHVRTLNTKTLTARNVPLTQRLHDELLAWRQTFKPADDESPLFGPTQNVPRSYGKARRAAGLRHLRFHDLRHTAGTRLQQKMPLAEVALILGHSDLKNFQMTYRYISTDATTLTRAAAILDEGYQIALKEHERTVAAQAVN